MPEWGPRPRSHHSNNQRDHHHSRRSQCDPAGSFWNDWRAGAGAQATDRREMARAWREHLREHLGEAPEGHWFFGGRRMGPGAWCPAGGNPMVSLFLAKGGGLLPLYVLHLLEQQARYGNDIMRCIRERTRGLWTANPGAIYPLLAGLEGHGLVSGQWEDPVKRTRRIYSLTDLGHDELACLREIMRPQLKEAADVFGRLVADLLAEETTSRRKGGDTDGEDAD